MEHSRSEVFSSVVNVHLLTENRLLRESLASVLLKRTGICVAGISDNIDTAAEGIASSHCEIVLTDCLTTERGTALLGRLVEESPRVIVFGMEEDLETFLKSAYLGIAGYILKGASASEMIGAIRSVAQGEAVYPPRLCMGLVQHLAQQARSWPRTADCESGRRSLTHRQLELVRLVAKGLTNKEIAASLNLSEFTVKNHMRRILRQMDAGNRYEAVDAVRATGYLSVV